MPCVSRIALRAFAGLAVLVVLCGSARAQSWKPQRLPVLELDSDDSDEQAEALTRALRSRVRSANEWTLVESTQSLSMLTAALRCPKRPDTACLQHIGDQIKSDRFVWGFVSKSNEHQVTADLHLWTRGKPDVGVKETYSDNLRDENDDTMRKIASRIFDRLTGGASAMIVVHAGTGDGTVTVDGDQKESLDHGAAALIVKGGPHVVEVRTPGFLVASQKVVAVPGSSFDVNVPLTPEAPSLPAEEPTGPRSTRRVLGWTGVIGGGALLAAGVALAIVFESNRSALNTDRQNNYGNATQGLTIEDPCEPPPGESNPSTTAGCNARNLAQAVLIPEIVALGAGGALVVTGISLLAGDTKQEPTSAVARMGLTRLRLTPRLGLRAGFLALSASF